MDQRDRASLFLFCPVAAGVASCRPGHRDLPGGRNLLGLPRGRFDFLVGRRDRRGRAGGGCAHHQVRQEGTTPRRDTGGHRGPRGGSRRRRGTGGRRRAGGRRGAGGRGGTGRGRGTGSRSRGTRAGSTRGAALPVRPAASPSGVEQQRAGPGPRRAAERRPDRFRDLGRLRGHPDRLRPGCWTHHGTHRPGPRT